MNYIDFIIIIILLISAVRGGMKGFIIEISSLAALILGVWGAMKFSGATEVFLVNRLNLDWEHINIVAFAVTLVLIVVLINYLAKGIEKILKATALSPVNRILGVVFSVAKSAFFIGVLIILLDKIEENVNVVPADNIKESMLYTPMKNVALSTFPFLEEIYKDLKEQNFKKEDLPEDLLPKKDKSTSI